MPEQVVAIQRSIWIAAERERVWDALTDAKQLSAWFAPGSPWEITELKLGGEVCFHLQPSVHNNHVQFDMHASIAVLEPPHRFGLRWQADEAGLSEFNIYTLVDEDGGTRLTLLDMHGLSELPDLPPIATAGGANEGYGLSLQNLKALIEGEPLPH